MSTSTVPCPACGSAVPVPPEASDGRVHCHRCGQEVAVSFRDCPTGFVPGVAMPEEWELLGKLGEGGMAEVFRARHRFTDESVALKCMLQTHDEGSPFAQRFAREMKVLARLNHPRVVRLLHSGRFEGRMWLALELVEGSTLRDRLRAGTMPIREAVRLANQIAQALAYTHAQGVVHRDLKPENVLLNEKADVKVTDFGLAGLHVENGAATRLTKLGTRMGTPRYMAPEQEVDALLAGPKADLYSLGVVLFEMLTNRLPHGAETPSKLREEISAELDLLVVQLLSFDPAARPESAEAVLELLRGSVPAPGRGHPEPHLAGSRVEAPRAVAGAVASPGGPKAGSPSVPPSIAPTFPEEFENLGVLGQDRNGQIFRARRRSTGEMATLQCFSRLPGSQANHDDRLRASLKTLQALASPRLAPIVEVGLEPACLWVATRWLREAALAERLEGHPLPSREATDLGRQLAEALAELHTRSLVHGCLEPLDILVDTAGSLCVRGSGISGLLASAGLSPARPPRDPEDEAGSYEAPELRTRPGVVTAAADLYALGVILFQMLVGRQPRGAETPSQAGALGLPARLETLVLRLIDPNPDRRPESATEVVRELTAIAKGAEMAVLVVETEPPGARIVLDGQDRGRAPVRAEKLPPGAHSVRAEAKFYRVEERLIDCAAGSSSVLRLALQALECERCGTRWVDEGMLTIHRRRCKGPRA